MKQSTFKISFCTDVERMPRSSPFSCSNGCFSVLTEQKSKDGLACLLRVGFTYTNTLSGKASSARLYLILPLNV